MKIVIAGSGDTGTHLAKMLSNEKQDVVLMSTQMDYLESLDATYNLMTYHGNPCSPSDLTEAGVPSADLFVAVTPYGAVNIVSCEIAGDLGAKATVARVEEEELTKPRMVTRFAEKGVGTLVYPEALAADDMMNYIERNWVWCWHTLHCGAINFAGVKITADSPAAGTMLKDFAGNTRKFHIVAIRRRGQLIIPRGSDTLQAGDLAYFTGISGSEDEIAAIAGQSPRKIRNVMICGGGALASAMISRIVEAGINVTFMSGDLKECELIAGQYPSVAVSHSMPKDISALREEGVGQMDLFVALGNEPSVNMVSAMLAKEMGARKVAAQIEDAQYLAEGERLGIDKVINKKLTTSGVILRSILRNSVRVKTVLALEDVEIAEIEAGEGSKVTRAAVKDLSLPSELTFGGLVRDGKGVLITGSTRILAGDVVMVAFLPGTMDKVGKLFGVRK